MTFVRDIAIDLPVHCLLDADGQLAPHTPAAERDPVLWRRALAHMRLVRRFDERIYQLQRTGRLAGAWRLEALTAPPVQLRPIASTA